MSSESRIQAGSRRRRLPKLLGGGLALVAVAALGVHLLAGPAGVHDGWRPHRPSPTSTTTAAGPFRLRAEPAEALVDEPVRIVVEDLRPGEDVLVRASTIDAEETRFESWARFVADADGRLDLDRAGPIDGTYRGIDGSGLLWSMTTEGDLPFVTSRSWSRRAVELAVETERGVQRTGLERIYPWNDLDVETVAEEGLRGELWAPAREAVQPVPGIVFLAGFGDGPAPLTSSLLAVRGFVVLNVGYHAWPGMPDDLVEVPVETVTRALDRLQADPRVEPERLAVWGVSKGAELALLAASKDSRVRAVAAWAPSSTVFGGISFRDPLPGSSWSHLGEPLPYAAPRLNVEGLRTSLRLALRRPVSFRAGYESALEAAESSGREEVHIAVEKIQGPVQLVAGGDDQMWPAAEMAVRIEERLDSSGFAHEVQVLVDPEAGHHARLALWPQGGGPTRSFIRGGSPEAAQRLGRRAWSALRSFLADALAPARVGDEH